MSQSIVIHHVVSATVQQGYIEKGHYRTDVGHYATILIIDKQGNRIDITLFPEDNTKQFSIGQAGVSQ